MWPLHTKIVVPLYAIARNGQVQLNCDVLLTQDLSHRQDCARLCALLPQPDKPSSDGVRMCAKMCTYTHLSIVRTEPGVLALLEEPGKASRFAMLVLFNGRSSTPELRRGS